MKKETYGPDAELATDDEAQLMLDEVFGEAEPAKDDAAFRALTEDEIEGIVGVAVEDAIDFIETEIQPRREKAMRYFSGQVDIGEEEGRSKIVATKCRDTVRAVKPSIQRVFMTSDRPVEFKPSGPEDVASMEQAGVYANAKFRQSNGYQILRDTTHDALVSICGFTKTHWAEYEEPKIFTFEGLDDDQFAAISDDPSITMLSDEAYDDEATIGMMQEQIQQAQMMAQQAQATGQQIDPAQMPQMPEVLPQLHDVRVLRRDPKGELRIDTVPPEEFFINRSARSDTDFYVIGQRTLMRVADVIAMGIDEEIALGLDADADDDDDGEVRRGYSLDQNDEQSAVDPSMKSVTMTEAYMRVDVDGTGIPVLHKFLLGGSGNTLLDYEPVDDHPFAGWHIDPEPHTYFGRSLVEIVEADQDAATSILRGILDNVMMTNQPRMEAVKGQVNMDDLLNNEIGGVVRVNAPGMLRDIAVPFVAGQTLPALQYVDQMVEVKTGVTRASMGLDPDAMQSTTRAAVQATVGAAAGQVEVMVSNLGYTGMRRMFCQILRLMSQHSVKEEMLRINGTYVPMDPRIWDGEMDATVNVGLGTGKEEQKLAVLGQTLALQQQVIQAYGPANPVAGLQQMRNTLADMLSMNGLHNADRYWLPIAPPQPGQAQQPQQGGQQGGDPAQALVQAEQIKAQAKMATDAQRIQLDAYKAQLQDDRERDRMTQDMEIAMAQVAGKYGIALDTARIKAEQAATSVQQPQQGQMPPGSGGGM